VEIRPAAPRIPDHEVLRCIGKGSYGEVWLARAVTGTLRAVKVVRREDFELDRTFEREFEGIMKFEPVSRDHPGLVHVLHVGRNDEQQFYYYVMELGDDRERGSRLDAADYEARTMGTDRAMKHRLPVADCIEYGAQVAEGLAHLHECGLTHRDIKPSNIIYVNGKAKLADIGLVAAAGQMTFVGTEGFVPPEGPGSKLADIYSLGMVLYELSTGKDRLQFPELPDDPGEARTRTQRLALNEIILKACALQPKKRFASARDMALALRAASRKKPKGPPWIGRLIALPFITAAAAFVIVTWQHHGAMPWPPGRFADKDGVAPPPPARDGQVYIQSRPPGVEVWWNEKMVGRTPLTASVPAGDANFTLRRKGYRDADITVGSIESGKPSSPPEVILRFDNPPKPGQIWEKNSLDMLFDPTPEGHISRRAVTYDQLQKVQALVDGAVVREVTGPNEELHLVGIPLADAARFCDELTQRETLEGWLTEDLCYRPEPFVPKDPDEAKKLKPGQVCFRLAVEKFGTIRIDSDPPGAEVYEGKLRLGTTPWRTFRHHPGPLEFRLTLPGYKETPAKGTLKSGSSLVLTVPLQKSKLAVFGKIWTNSLDVPMVPLSPDVLTAIWETRVQDYAAFAKARGVTVRLQDEDKNGKDDLDQEGTHPVVNVTRQEARQFCRWLTDTERAADYLDESMEYRLPTDTEWSLAAGSPNLNELRRTPAERHLAVTGVYPWVPPYQFPPPTGNAKSKLPPDIIPTKAAGNLGDLTALKRGALGTLKPAQIKALEEQGYDDEVAFTSPAGQFAPNGIGLFDLSGNVWEFVEEDYGGGKTPGRQAFAVLRGGGWNTLAAERDELATQFRNAIPADKFDVIYGFRVVLALITPSVPPAVPTANGTTNPPASNIPPYEPDTAD
jgi:hypothetical protein